MSAKTWNWRTSSPWSVTRFRRLSRCPTTIWFLMIGVRALKLNAETLKITLQQHGIKDKDILNVLTTGSRRETPSVRSRVQSVGNQQSEMRGLISNLVSQIRVPGARKMSQSQSSSDETRDSELRKLTRRLFDQLANDPGHIRDYKLKAAPRISLTQELSEHFHQAFVEFDKNQRRLHNLRNDANSVEGQQYIAEMIRQNNIKEQYQYALEHFPESYIPIGAQQSIISTQIAKKCNIFDNVDERFFTKASGIGGTSKVRGRIHVCKLQIGNTHLSGPLDVLDENRVEILLGLTFLRPNGCIIDCKRNVLILNETEVPFLGEEQYKREVKRLGQTAIGPIDEDRPSTSGTSAPAASSPPATATEVDSEKLAVLIGMGIEYETAVDALKRFNNDVHQALQFLLSSFDRSEQNE
ncbi:Protein DDI1-like protein 2 [Aphelenchoides besseyi]|nr:Protein DDI1-like protein 2 [Aphelenchoides besseyi]